MSPGAVAQYVAHIDQLLTTGHALFPAGGEGPVMVAAGSGDSPTTPSGGGELSVGATRAGQHYRRQRSAVSALDSDTGSTAEQGKATGEEGRAATGAVVGTARAQSAAIAPATGSPAGVRLLVRTMDERLAQMQREIDAARAQNRLLALRLRQLALAYRAGGGSGAFGGAPGAFGGGPFGAGSGGSATPPGGSLVGSGIPVGAIDAPLRQLSEAMNREPAGVAARAVAFAETKMGRPYIWGARGPDAYDCSGLVCDAYAHAGVVLPRTTYDQISCGIPISRSDMRPGDLVFSNFSAPGRPEHVQLAVSSSEVIEAPTPGGHVQLHSVASGPVEIRRVA